MAALETVALSDATIDSLVLRLGHAASLIPLTRLLLLHTWLLLLLIGHLPLLTILLWHLLLGLLTAHHALLLHVRLVHIASKELLVVEGSEETRVSISLQLHQLLLLLIKHRRRLQVNLVLIHSSH